MISNWWRGSDQSSRSAAHQFQVVCITGNLATNEQFAQQHVAQYIRRSEEHNNVNYVNCSHQCTHTHAQTHTQILHCFC